MASETIQQLLRERAGSDTFAVKYGEALSSPPARQRWQLVAQAGRPAAVGSTLCDA
jgi:hypothetical protein